MSKCESKYKIYFVGEMHFMTFRNPLLLLRVM